MNRLSRRSSTQMIAGLALAVGSLFLMSSSKPACANGYFVFRVATPSNDSSSYADTGSGTTYIFDQTSSVGSYSTYDAQPHTSDTSAHIDASFTLRFDWYNADGNTPSPHGMYTVAAESSIDGTVTGNGGASANSSANYLDEMSTDATHPSYSNTGGDTLPSANPGSELDATGNMHAATSASPDNSYDPKNENYGKPTAGAAGASVGVTVNQANSSPPLS